MVRFSKAVEAARQRREALSLEKDVKFRWFLDEVASRIRLTAKQRVKLATEFLRNKVVLNISRPVVKAQGKRSRRVQVVQRSRPGEFPRADTTTLMKSIFGEVRNESVGPMGYVGTPLDYGLCLEVSLDRSFLVRTLLENVDTISRILNGPLR